MNLKNHYLIVTRDYPSGVPGAYKITERDGKFGATILGNFVGFDIITRYYLKYFFICKKPIYVGCLLKPKNRIAKERGWEKDKIFRLSNFHFIETKGDKKTADEYTGKYCIYLTLDNDWEFFEIKNFDVINEKEKKT